MKKTLILALALVIVMAGTAFAGPFADVPTNHWSYAAVDKLAQAGIIDGYGDGTFRGDRTMTRYEMAQIVGKAMERSDKADAETKALINKLSDEYAKELDNLGVRVASLEKKVGNITWTGQVRQWYQNIDNGGTQRHTRLLLWATAPLGKDMNFIGRLTSWGDWGATGTDDDRVGDTLEMDNAYIQGKNFTFGRQPMTLGKGLVWNSGYNTDGATYTFGSDECKVTLAAFRGLAAFGFGPGNQPELNVQAINVAYKASKDLDLTAVYAKNQDEDRTGVGNEGDDIKTWAIGATYTGINNITLTGEYGVNSSDYSNRNNNNDDSKSWVAQAKYRGAQWTTPHTWGFWVGYRDGDKGFVANTGDPLWETPFGISQVSDIKGADYGIEYSIFKNSILTFNYFDLEKQDGTDQEAYTAQLRYFF